MQENPIIPEAELARPKHWGSFRSAVAALLLVVSPAVAWEPDKPTKVDEWKGKPTPEAVHPADDLWAMIDIILADREALNKIDPRAATALTTARQKMLAAQGKIEALKSEKIKEIRAKMLVLVKWEITTAMALYEKTKDMPKREGILKNIQWLQKLSADLAGNISTDTLVAAASLIPAAQWILDREVPIANKAIAEIPEVKTVNAILMAIENGAVKNGNVSLAQTLISTRKMLLWGSLKTGLEQTPVPYKVGKPKDDSEVASSLLKGKLVISDTGLITLNGPGIGDGAVPVLLDAPAWEYVAKFTIGEGWIRWKWKEKVMFFLEDRTDRKKIKWTELVFAGNGVLKAGDTIVSEPFQFIDNEKTPLFVVLGDGKVSPIGGKASMTLAVFPRVKKWPPTEVASANGTTPPKPAE